MKRKVIDYIIKEYDKNYRLKFYKKEFTDQAALKEIMEELKETKNIKIHRNYFVMKRTGIRYLKNIITDLDNNYNSTKTSAISLLLSSIFSISINLLNVYFDNTILYTLLSTILIGYIMYLIKKLE